ncbi:MAG TPA: S8 family peptidase [Crinalium sp.]|jgi:subtilisin family serine protease
MSASLRTLLPSHTARSCQSLDSPPEANPLFSNRHQTEFRRASSLAVDYDDPQHHSNAKRISTPHKSLKSQASQTKTQRSPLKSVFRRLSLAGNQQRQGSLNSSDRRNPQRKGRYADEYVLKGVQAGQWVTVNLKSNQFDAYLQLIDGSTGRILAQNDDATLDDSDNAKLNFTVQAGVTYYVRVTSYATRETGKYSLFTRTPATILPNTYTVDYGYGLVNAAAAVARTAGQPTYADVADLGGFGWGLDLIKAPEAWAQGFTGQGVTVAVLDTGVDYRHVDLKDNIWTNPGEIPGNGIDDDRNGYVDDVNGWNFADGGNNDPSDLDSHGTHVSGTIAAVNNGFGVTGVAYSAKIMPVKVIGGSEDLNPTQFDINVAAGIRYAVANGAKVLNLSLGNDPGDPSMIRTRAALEYAKQQGVVAVMAAGNEKLDGAIRPIQPALFAGSHLGIAVGAVNIGKQVADFSNPAGDRPLDYVVAPGVNVRSTVPGDQYENQGWEGTSMATPHVTGVIALMLSANPTLTPDQVETILVSSASSTGISVF